MKKINATVSSHLLIEFAAIFVTISLMSFMSVVDYYIQFSFELSILTCFHYLDNFIMGSVIWITLLIFLFFTFNIYKRYDTLNEHLR